MAKPEQENKAMNTASIASRVEASGTAPSPFSGGGSSSSPSPSPQGGSAKSEPEKPKKNQNKDKQQSLYNEDGKVNKGYLASLIATNPLLFLIALLVIAAKEGPEKYKDLMKALSEDPNKGLTEDQLSAQRQITNHKDFTVENDLFADPEFEEDIDNSSDNDGGTPDVDSTREIDISNMPSVPNTPLEFTVEDDLNADPEFEEVTAEELENETVAEAEAEAEAEVEAEAEYEEIQEQDNEANAEAEAENEYTLEEMEEDILDDLNRELDAEFDSSDEVDLEGAKSYTNLAELDPELNERMETLFVPDEDVAPGADASSDETESVSSTEAAVDPFEARGAEIQSQVDKFFDNQNADYSAGMSSGEMRQLDSIMADMPNALSSVSSNDTFVSPSGEAPGQPASCGAEAASEGPSVGVDASVATPA